MSARKYLLSLAVLTGFWHSSLVAEVLDDPTRPPDYRFSARHYAGTKAAPRWVLSQTLIAPNRRAAIINGKNVAIGENIAGARVVAIESARVSLRKGNKDIYLELLPRDFKRLR